MLNVVSMAGRIVKMPENLNDNEYRMVIRVQRNFQNVDGDYDSDSFDIILWKGLGEEIRQYCKKNDTVILRGRIEKHGEETVIIAETMNFIR